MYYPSRCLHQLSDTCDNYLKISQKLNRKQTKRSPNLFHSILTSLSKWASMNQFTQGIHQDLCGTSISLPSSFPPSLLPSAFLPAFLCCPPLSFHKQFLEQIMHWIQFYALGFCQTTWLGFFTHGVQTRGMESLYFCFPFEWYFCWIKNSKNSRFFVILLFLFSFNTF